MGANCSHLIVHKINNLKKVVSSKIKRKIKLITITKIWMNGKKMSFGFVTNYQYLHDWNSSVTMSKYYTTISVPHLPSVLPYLVVGIEDARNARKMNFIKTSFAQLLGRDAISIWHLCLPLMHDQKHWWTKRQKLIHNMSLTLMINKRFCFNGSKKSHWLMEVSRNYQIISTTGVRWK